MTKLNNIFTLIKYDNCILTLYPGKGCYQIYYLESDVFQIDDKKNLTKSFKILNSELMSLNLIVQIKMENKAYTITLYSSENNFIDKLRIGEKDQDLRINKTDDQYFYKFNYSQKESFNYTNLDINFNLNNQKYITITIIITTTIPNKEKMSWVYIIIIILVTSILIYFFYSFISKSPQRTKNKQNKDINYCYLNDDYSINNLAHQEDEEIQEPKMGIIKKDSTFKNSGM